MNCGLWVISGTNAEFLILDRDVTPEGYGLCRWIKELNPASPVLRCVSIPQPSKRGWMMMQMTIMMTMVTRSQAATLGRGVLLTQEEKTSTE
jgi:hypothetical protein